MAVPTCATSWRCKALSNVHLLSPEKQLSSKTSCSFFIPDHQGPDSCVQSEFTQNASQVTFWCVGILLLLLFCFLSLADLQVACGNAEM